MVFRVTDRSNVFGECLSKRRECRRGLGAHLQRWRMAPRDQGRPSADEYELLTQSIVRKLTADAPVRTLRVDQDVQLAGQATRHAIDVMWEFEDSRKRHLVLFECRSYKRPLVQSAVLAWKGVVDDVSAVQGTCEGVMCTTTGYQRGARAVADTYGVVILELRSPTDSDLAGRAVTIHIDLQMRMPFVRDIRFHAVEILDAGQEGRTGAIAADIQVEREGGERRSIHDVLLAGETGPLGSPAVPAHVVSREFDPPVTLIIENEPTARIVRVEAIVGEHVPEPHRITVGGRDTLAWMLKNTLDGTHAWFTTDGRHHVTD